jgi:uncharacterized membrane protein YphA (DoxX/SURF4 family)
MKKIILTVVCVLFGLMFINSGLNKFLGYMPMPTSAIESMKPYLEIGWLLPLVGFIEVLGGILFIFKQVRALGAIVIFPILVGIFLFNITHPSSAIIIVVILWAIELWVLFENKRKYILMVK